MRSLLTQKPDKQHFSAIRHDSLLENFVPSSDAFFSSTTCTLLAKPPFANLLTTGFDTIAEQAKQSIQFAKELGHKNPYIVGAIAFNANDASYLRLSTATQRAIGHDDFAQKYDECIEPVHASEPTITYTPSEEAYGNSVLKALEKFARGELQKVVLSRTLDIKYPSAVNANQLVRNLTLKNPQGYRFSINLKPVNTPLNNTRVHALVGASPELLIAKRGKHVFAHPLAGSEPRTNRESVDKQSEARLLNSKKDRYEHALVVKAIKQSLAPFCKHLSIPDTPDIVKTPTMLHLGTFIQGELESEHISSLELALALHPTPAVCGYPAENAKHAINELENYQRNLFTGFVGWSDENGDGEWAVTIRCAEINDSHITVYAGAGIVEGSNPEKETLETKAKFSTMLNAMGVN